ncbi:ClbS/DfsB family four-helix bundle protein [Pasteurella oralis]|uniref:ClbS/DfsB family four-helix bundle protein n=1 Tax=Pasteurella oralis TaxID=1071947 RepID=UPI000C7BED11|nr:ClbS/DfsB family four-helix bundle protein [Pasteurella oralis]
MRHYANKTELKNEIQKTYEKYILAFEGIPENLKDKACENVDRTPAQNLAYQVGWTTLLLKWESNEREGLDVKTPSDDFKWNQLGKLYQWFNKQYAYLSLAELKLVLANNIQELYLMIDTMADTTLFLPHQRKWTIQATKTATWAVYQFIHINTVAPFTTFRSKIIKWKKCCL